MSKLSKNKRWVIYTGLILWGLTILLTFNTIVSLKVLASVSVKVLPGLDITALALILILLGVINILTWRKRSKLMERTRYVLPLAILVAFYVVAWVLNFTRNLLSLNDLIEILYFAIIFSTVFTAVVIPVSLYIYRRRWRIFNLTSETKQREHTS
ncbi:MAG: hypothetical protein B7O98_09235 [Zestosphaera tikiterensis]|uniref:Uncharacterized protein n=1 Tax=Zestosphaera tikiterensis TaxID=1973259 RepID=A0A2R7Y1Z4_9CREN|nr:MAG: hypothetical protein B7O98_09235 [Zestosphaera tikiterensis]